MIFIKQKLKSGDPIAKVPASFFNDVDEVLSQMSIDTAVGTIEKQGKNWTFQIYHDTVTFVTDIFLDSAQNLRVKKRTGMLVAAQPEYDDYFRNPTGVLSTPFAQSTYDIGLDTSDGNLKLIKDNVLSGTGAQLDVAIDTTAAKIKVKVDTDYTGTGVAVSACT